MRALFIDEELKMSIKSNGQNHLTMTKIMV